MSYAEKIKREQKDAFEKMAQNGQRFCLSIDEWTSTKNKRYMCVNLHMNESKVISLGMKRINGAMNLTLGCACSNGSEIPVLINR